MHIPYSRFLTRARALSSVGKRRAQAMCETRYLRRRHADFIELDVGKFAYMGFGASIGWTQAAYLAADALGAKVLVLNPNAWPFGGRHKACALDRFISFPEAEIRHAETRGAIPIVASDFDNFRKWGYYDSLTWPTCLFGYTPENFDSLEAYRRSVLARMYQPTEFAMGQITPRLNYLPAAYFAWHIRRGDKTSGLWKEDDAVPIKEYAKATTAVLERNPGAPRTIVICSDSMQAVDEARSVASRIAGGMEVIYDTGEKRWNGYCELHRTGKISDVQDMVEEVLTAQTVVETMRRADYLIGCNSSCLFRLGALLNDNAKNVISLSENKVFKKWYPI